MEQANQVAEVIRQKHRQLITASGVRSQVVDGLSLQRRSSGLTSGEGIGT